VAKHKRRRGGGAVIEPHTLEQRIERALSEQRYQHALELARTLHRTTPAPYAADLLVRAALKRAGQLTASNYLRDAAAVLTSVVKLARSPEQQEALAVALAECGEFEQALRLAGQLSSPGLQARILGHAADASMRERSVLAAGLPADFQTQRSLIVKAFAEVQAGRDEEARTTLQGIGLSSPFLEWKVLLRGLLAYYQNDDERALENWQRLEPQRVPARLAAPFRQAIDPSYRHAQPPETQTRLLNLFDQLQGTTLIPRLRQTQQSLSNPRQLAQAFRQAEGLLPALKAEAPQLVARLAACFFWTIIDHGFPEDLKRYQRLFGTPPEDASLNRLEALAVEHRGDFERAHDAWQRFERGLAQHAAAFPPGHAEHMRALVWQRMGDNAAQMPDMDLRDRLGGLNGMRLPRPLTPGAEECFKRSLELAPDQLDAHKALIRFYLDEEKFGKALQAAKRLVKQFPDHAPTLELAGDLSLRKSDYKDAVLYFSCAVQANPLAASLRGKLGAAHAGRGAELAESGAFAEARAEFQAASTLCEGSNEIPVLCKWAATEFLAGEPGRAEELLQKARAQPALHLAVAFSMLIHAIRLKLGKPLKARFDKEVKELLDQPPSAASARGLAVTFAGMRLSGVKYVGQKTHEKKLLAYLEKALVADFAEAELVDVCQAVSELKSVTLLRKYFNLGQKRFPNNPQFYLAEVDYNLSLPPYRLSHPQTKELLDKVRELASRLPQDQREPLLEAVKDREEQLRERNPFAALFGSGLFDPFWAEDDDEDDYDDDDWDY
jgi:tetratricopeptide (TPR) repeat protein